MYCSSYARCLFPFLPRALSSSVPSSLCLSASRNSFVIGHGSLNYQISKIVQGHVEVSSSRKLNCWFSTFSASQDLATKKCVPCNSKDIRLMSAQSAHELLVKVQGWDLVDEGGTLKLHRSWKVKNFTKGLEFFKLVSDVAEAEGHHPDLHLVGWNNVMIDIWTHSVGGLTENDFILAAKISSLDLQPLLRRKPTA